MAREKGMGNLQKEKSGRWTMRVGIKGVRYCRSTRTKDRDQAERVLQRFLAPFGLGELRLPLADVWLEYVKSPKRNHVFRFPSKVAFDCSLRLDDLRYSYHTSASGNLCSPSPNGARNR